MIDFSATRFDWRRALTSYSKVQTLLGYVLRNRRVQLQRISDHKRYLDVGCGPNTHPSFVNLDYAWRPGVDACWDVTKGLPFETGRFDGAFSEHCLEHLAFEEGLRLLREIRRVLATSGVLRIVVPDGELYAKIYVATRNGEPAEFPYQANHRIGSIYTPIMSLNQVFLMHGHRFIYDFETLSRCLLEAGFCVIRRVGFGVGADENLLLDSPNRKDESLYIEAFC